MIDLSERKHCACSTRLADRRSYRLVAQAASIGLLLGLASSVLASQDVLQRCALIAALPDSQVKEPSLADDLEGVYDIVFVATGGTVEDSMVQGSLVLHPNDTAMSRTSDPGFTVPFFGATTTELSRLGPVQFATPPSSDGPDAPGVQVFYDSVAGELTLFVGIPRMFKGDRFTIATHAGLMLRVTKADRTGFAGSWIGSLGLDGHYCALRR
jgi:hypothetical protein